MDKVLAVCLVARDNRKRGNRRSSANTKNRYYDQTYLVL